MPVESLPGALDWLETLEGHLADRNDYDTETRIATMLRLQDIAKLAASLAKELSLALAKDLKDRGMKAEAHGPYVIEWKSTAKREWDNSRLLARVIEWADEQGAELHGTLLKVAAFGYWRLTDLKALGFDPHAFCDEKWSEPQVIVVEDGSHASTES